MTTSTTHPSIAPVDDDPLVKPIRPRVQLIDRDSDGQVDVYLWDVNHDGEPEIEYHVADRRTLLTLPVPRPWEVPPSLTIHTGEAGDVPLRVTCRVQSLGGKSYEVNGSPVLPASHAMASLSLAWDGDREREDETRAAIALLVSHGGVKGFERA